MCLCEYYHSIDAMLHRKSAVSIDKSNYTQVPESPRKRRIAKVVVGGGVALTAIVVTYMVTLGVVGLVSFVPQPTLVEISAMPSPISSIRDRLGVNASSLITPFNAKIVDAMASELVTSIGNGNARPSSFPIVDTITPFNKKISSISPISPMSSPMSSAKASAMPSPISSKPAKIDIVYLWVNGSDVTVDAMRRKYMPVESPRALTGAVSENRFREWNELFYSLSLTYENVRNLGNVYVMTSGEIHHKAQSTFPRVKWVNSSTFLSRYPSFSSTGIQFSLINFLKNLSDPFVLLDDDMFIMKPIDLHAFSNGRIWYESSWGKQWGSVPSSKHQYVRAIQNCNKAIHRVFPQHVCHNVPAHVPGVIHHKTLRFALQHFREVQLTAESRFRSRQRVQFQCIMSNIERYTLADVRFTKDSAVVDFVMMGDNIEKMQMRFAAILRRPKQFMTLNDDIEHPTQQHVSTIHTFLSALKSAKHAKHATQRP